MKLRNGKITKYHFEKKNKIFYWLDLNEVEKFKKVIHFIEKPLVDISPSNCKDGIQNC